MKKAANESSKQPWGLVLMGGGARGLAHIGVLKVLSANGLVPDVITGTSMGAIVGGFYAAGIPPEEMENLTTALGYAPLVEKPLLGRRPRTMTAFFQQIMIETSRDRLLQRIGVDREDRIEAILNKIVGDRMIEELDIRFGCNAVDILSGREVVFTNGLLRKAIRASMAYPLAFEPVPWEKMLLVDGGLINTVPVELARHLNASRVLAPDIHKRLEKFPRTGINNIFKLLTRMSQIVLTNEAKMRLATADLSYRVEVNVEDFDFSESRTVIAEGRKATEKNLDAIKAFVAG
jgi:NTE family protein